MSFTAQNVCDMASRELVDLSDTAYLSDMVEYINEGIRRLATNTHCCQELLDYDLTGYRLTFSTIKGEFSTVESVLTIASVYFAPSNQYLLLHKDDTVSGADFAASTQTTPSRWKQFGSSIIFDATMTAMSLRVLFSYIPKMLTVRTETIPMPDECINALAKYVVYCARLSDRDAGLANGAFADFEIMREALAKKYALEMVA
jgi:hypothetical protein